MAGTPPKKNTAYTFYVGLQSQAQANTLQANPTLATGDVKVSIDGGAFNNLGTLPTIAPAAGKRVKVVMTSAEMNGDAIGVLFSDAAGAEWKDLLVELETSTRQIDDLAYPATTGRSIVVDAAGLVDANAVKLGPTGAGTAQTARDIGTSVLLSTGTGTGQLDFTSGVVKSNAVQMNGSTTPVLAEADFFAMMPRGTASAGASNTLTLVAPAVATGSFYLGWTLWLTGGTGAGQARLVSSYTSGRLVTILSNWTTTPDATTTYLLTPFGQANVENWRNAAVSAASSGAIQADLTLINANNTTTNQFLSFLLSLQRATAQAGAASTITLAATALANDSAYVGDMVIIASGTGASQARRITAYVGSTRVATVDRAWDTNPDNTSVYILDVFANAPDANVSSISSGVDFTTTMKAATLARVTLTDTATALTNASTAGDFTATMKTSLNAATPAVTVSDKTGFSLSTAGVKAIWDQLMAALTTTGSVGKLLGDDLDAAISSRTKPADTQAAVTLVTTTTNLTNAPTAGDLTATMKTSVGTAVAASAVASVTADVGITQAGADKVWSTATRALTDKVGFALSTAGTLAIWDKLTSALVTSGSVGKLIVDFLDAAVSSRMATFTYTAPDNADIVLIKAKTDNLPGDPADASDVAAAFAALNNLSAAQVRTQADAALTAYDAPTHAEMTAELATAVSGLSTFDSSADPVLIADGALTSAKFAGGFFTKIADVILRRSFASAAGSSDGDTKDFRSLLGAVAKQVNRVEVVSTTLSVYEADDTTVLGTQTVTSNANADAITGVNTDG